MTINHAIFTSKLFFSILDTAGVLTEKYGVAVLGTIPIDPNFGNALDNGEDFISQFNQSNTAIFILKIIDAISDLINV